MDVYVAIHGYSSEAHKNVRSSEQVQRNRLSTGVEVTEALANLGGEVTVLLGGSNTTIEDYINHSPNLIHQLKKHRVKNTSGGNTRKEVKGFIDEAQEAFAMFAVTSRDHAPRALREWNSVKRCKGFEGNVFVTGSNETYVENDVEPFVLEGAAFKPFLKVLNEELWNVNPNNYEEAAEEIAEVLQKYQ